MKVVGIVQARMNSTRLPGKVLKAVLGKPLIVHMLDRVSRSAAIDELWLATSDKPADDSLAQVVAANRFRVFRGSENDVLDRFDQLARKADADVVVRLTGDCPLHDPGVIDKVVRAFLGARPPVVYASNIHPATFPDGLDVEVFSSAVLHEVAAMSTNVVEREHVTPGIHGQIREPPAMRPKILSVVAPADFGHLRWTLDYPEDYSFVSQVYEALVPVRPEFSWMDIIALLSLRPDLLQLNCMHMRNSAFLEDLRNSGVREKNPSDLTSGGR